MADLSEQFETQTDQNGYFSVTRLIRRHGLIRAA